MERKEWLKWRQGGIGSSDAPIIMGVSPYSTPLKLWEEKIAAEPKEDTSNQWIKDKGNRIEPKVRELYETLRGFMNFSVALIEMDSPVSYLRASLDGISDDKEELIEIKLLGRDLWLRSKDSTLPVRDRIPAHYWPQIQHQLMVTGAKVCYLLGYCDIEGDGMMREDNLSVVAVLPDHEYIHLLRQLEVNFWTLVLTKTPPAFSDGDYKTLKFKGAAGLVNKYKRLKLRAEQMKDEMDDIKSILVKNAKEEKHPRLKVAGAMLLEVEREGSVDYKTLAEDAIFNAKLFYSALMPEAQERVFTDARKTANLEAYRKAGSKSWTIRIDKEVES